MKPAHKFVSLLIVSLVLAALTVEAMSLGFGPFFIVSGLSIFVCMHWSDWCDSFVRWCQSEDEPEDFDIDSGGAA